MYEKATVAEAGGDTKHPKWEGQTYISDSPFTSYGLDMYQGLTCVVQYRPQGQAWVSQDSENDAKPDYLHRIKGDEQLGIHMADH